MRNNTMSMFAMCSLAQFLCLSVLFAMVSADHCGQGPFNLNCGSDQCAEGFWIGSTPHPSLVFTTGCAYVFDLTNGGGNPLIITDDQRNLVSGVTQHATSGQVTWTPSQRGSYFYLDENKNEFRAYITVVTDGVWGAWSTCCAPDCSASSTNTRSCSQPVSATDYFGNTVNGDTCTGSNSRTCDTSTCNTAPSWGAWQGCVTSYSAWGCGTSGTNTRTCNGQTGCNGACSTTPVGATMSCSLGPCDGGWSSFGTCPCGQNQYQTRTCSNPPVVGGAACPGCRDPLATGGCTNSPAVDTQSCYSGVCPGHDCGYLNSCPSCTCTANNCTQWASCNCDPVADAGKGWCTRPNITSPLCNYNSYGWSAWSNCACTYPTSGQACTNTRTCNRPSSKDCDPQVGVSFCQGSNSRANTTRLCPPRYWSNWGGCTVPQECLKEGGGTRQRNCVNTGGAPCVGPSIEVCNNDSCNGYWTAWAGCSRDCGGGLRSRSCVSSLNGGTNCTDLGSAEQFVGVCNTHDCGCILDMCFALDGSASIIPNSWILLKQFSVQILSLINAGNGTQAAVVQFSDAKISKVEQPMTTSLYALTSDINNLVQQKGSTAIGEGILLCEQQIEWYNRPLIANVMLIITDGSQNDGPPSLYEAGLAKANGTEIFVIGVGGDVNLTELYELASEPKDTHLFNISDYNALLAIADQVTQNLCFGRGEAAAAANFYPFLALLALVPLGFGICVIRRRKPIKKAPPPPPAKVEEPPPPPPSVRAAAPKPITDKPKDWTVPGTRYIGFGQANIKVKWGTEAPPSAPRGHDKYDRWSMMAHPDGMKPGSPSSKALEVETGSNEEAMTGGGPGSPAGGPAARVGCCARFCPCCCAPRALNQTKAKVGGKGKKTIDDDEDADWQSNPAAH